MQASALSAALLSLADAQHAAVFDEEQRAVATVMQADRALAQQLQDSREEDTAELAAAFAAAEAAAEEGTDCDVLTVTLRFAGATVGANPGWGPSGCCAQLALPCGEQKYVGLIMLNPDLCVKSMHLPANTFDAFYHSARRHETCEAETNALSHVLWGAAIPQGRCCGLLPNHSVTGRPLKRTTWVSSMACARLQTWG